MSVQHIFETYFSYRGYLLALYLQIYLETSSLKRANNVPNLPGVKLGTSHDLKGFAIGLFLKRIVVERANDDLCSAQNRSISSEICLENNHKIGRFLPITFLWSLPRKLPRNSREIGRFFSEFVPQNPAKFDFFFRDLSEALISGTVPSLPVLRLPSGGSLGTPKILNTGDTLLLHVETW